MSNYDITDHGNSQIWAADESQALAAANSSVSSHIIGTAFIIIIQIGTFTTTACNKNTNVAALQLQFSKDGGAWTDVGAATEISYTEDTTLVNEAASTNRSLPTTGTTACASGWAAGKECTDGITSHSILTQYFSEIQYALQTENASAGSTYTFRIYNTTTSAALVNTVAADITVSLPPAPEPSVYDSITVTDVPSASLPDSLNASTYSGVSITEAVGDTEVVNVIEIDDISVYLVTGSAISVNDSVGVTEDITVTTVTPNIPVVVFDSTGTSEEVTVTLSDLAISAFDTTTVTEDVAEETLVFWLVSVFSSTVVSENITLSFDSSLSVTDEVTTEDTPTLEVTTQTDVTDPWDDYDQDGTLDQDTNARFIVPADEIKGSGNRVAITFASKGTTWGFDSLYIGHPADSGDVYDFDGNQVEVTFDGSSGATISATTQSDFVSFNLDASKPLVFAFFFSSEQQVPEKLATVSYDLYFKVGTDESAITDVTDYTQHPTYYLRRFLGKITVETVLGEDLDIASFDTASISEYAYSVVTPLFISVYSESAIAENVTALMGDIEAFSFSSVSVGEFTAFVNDRNLSVFSAASLAEYAEIIATLLETPTIDIFSTTTVTDATTVLLSDIEATVVDTIALSEDVSISNQLLYTLVYDEVGITEGITFSFESTISVNDSAAVQESVVTSNSPLSILTYSATAVAESTSLTMSDIITSVFDVVNVLDVPTVVAGSPAILYISVTDSTGITEYAVVSAIVDGDIDVGDDIVLTEQVTLELSSLAVSAYSAISLTEEVNFSFEAFISLFDSIIVDEYVAAYIGDLGISKFEAASVVEFISAQSTLGNIFSYEEVGVLDETDVICVITGVSVYDTITVVDSPAVSLGIPASYQIAVSDAVFVSEAISFFYQEYKVIVNELVTITENLEFLGVFLIGTVKIKATAEPLNIEVEVETLECIMEVV